MVSIAEAAVGRMCVEVPAGLNDAGNPRAVCSLSKIGSFKSFSPPTQFFHVHLHQGFATPIGTSSTSRLTSPTHATRIKPDRLIEYFTVPLQDLWRTFFFFNQYSRAGYTYGEAMGRALKA